jgi:hypothetical protein
MADRSGSLDKILDEVRRLPVEQRQILLERLERELSPASAPASELALPADQQRQLWQDWVDTGPQGPLDDAGR